MCVVFLVKKVVVGGCVGLLEFTHSWNYRYTSFLEYLPGTLGTHKGTETTKQHERGSRKTARRKKRFSEISNYTTPALGGPE